MAFHKERLAFLTEVLTELNYSLRKILGEMLTFFIEILTERLTDLLEKLRILMLTEVKKVNRAQHFTEKS